MVCFLWLLMATQLLSALRPSPVRAWPATTPTQRPRSARSQLRLSHVRLGVLTTVVKCLQPFVVVDTWGPTAQYGVSGYSVRVAEMNKIVMVISVRVSPLFLDGVDSQRAHSFCCSVGRLRLAKLQRYLVPSHRLRLRFDMHGSRWRDGSCR